MESPFEVEAIRARAAHAGKVARLALRLNPDVDPNTHAYISTGQAESKFGLDLTAAAAAVPQIAAAPELELVGYHVHLGSQLWSEAPYRAALDRVEEFLNADPARRQGVRYFDLGGGFGVAYELGGAPMPVERVADALVPRITAHGWTPVVEPGRFLVADAGILVTRVLGTKPSVRRFVIVDAAMNDLLRPALYGASHPIAACRRSAVDRTMVACDVVGPVCESGDFLGKDVALPDPCAGDLLAVFGAGAYGAAMASNYNSRPRAAEVLVDGGTAHLIRRRRERVDELWQAELVDERWSPAR